MHTLFISNIDYRVSRVCLYDLLVQAAPVRRLEYSSRIAFASYFAGEEMEQSCAMLNGVRLYGRRIFVQKAEPRVAVEVACSSWCDASYIGGVFGRFGPCRCRKWKDRHLCIYRRRADAEKAVEKMNRRRILGNEFSVQIIPAENSQAAHLLGRDTARNGAIIS